MFARCGLQT